MTRGVAVAVLDPDEVAAVAPLFDRRRVVARLTEDERVELAGRRLERRAARMGRRDAEAGRWPPRAPTLQRFRGAYARAFVEVLVARWPAPTVVRVRKRTPWVFRYAEVSPPHGTILGAGPAAG